tara:strand:- start:51 stop:596 length:546 start_codon:yes stop_codon:yes gene_type:complete
MVDDRIGVPVGGSSLLLKRAKDIADIQLKEGKITKEDYDEIIQILFPNLELTDKKAGGGMMNINDMITPIGMRNGGDPVQERMSMLRESMRDDEAQTMRGADITGVAFRIAQDQGDTSEENIRLITNQLMALVPSLMKTVEDETTPLFSKGVTSLFDKAKVLFGLKSDPKLRRDVGFSRVD